jgi:flagellar biosynthesis/type III secretory pathway chaperone
MINSAPIKVDILLALIQLLERLNHRTEAFHQLVLQEHKAIRGVALQELTGIHEAKLQLLGEIRSLEERRAELIRQLAAAWEVPTNILTIAEIARRAANPEAETLRRLQRRLTRAAAEAHEANKVTGTLIRRSIALLHEALKAWQDNLPALATYSHAGIRRIGSSEGGLLEREGK